MEKTTAEMIRSEEIGLRKSRARLFQHISCRASYIQIGCSRFFHDRIDCLERDAPIVTVDKMIPGRFGDEICHGVRPMRCFVGLTKAVIGKDFITHHETVIIIKFGKEWGERFHMKECRGRGYFTFRPFTTTLGIIPCLAMEISWKSASTNHLRISSFAWCDWWGGESQSKFCCVLTRQEG